MKRISLLLSIILVSTFFFSCDKPCELEVMLQGRWIIDVNETGISDKALTEDLFDLTTLGIEFKEDSTVHYNLESLYSFPLSIVVFSDMPNTYACLYALSETGSVLKDDNSIYENWSCDDTILKIGTEDRGFTEYNVSVDDEILITEIRNMNQLEPISDNSYYLEKTTKIHWRKVKQE